MSEWEEKDDGGRINPKIDLERRRGDYRIVELAPGLTRRDWLAGMFAQGMVANPGFLAVLGQTAAKANMREDQITAKAAYELADAVIAEGNK